MLSNILRTLEDGRWHLYREIANETGLSEEAILSVFRFLNEFDFVNIDDERRRVKLDSSFLGLPT